MTLGGIVACGVGMVAFVVMVLLVMRSEGLVSRRSTFVLLGLFLVVGVGGLGVGYFSDKANRQSASEAADEYWPLKIAAIAEVTTDLERAYGITPERATTLAPAQGVGAVRDGRHAVDPGGQRRGG